MQAKQQPFLLVFVFAVVCVLSAMALVYTCLLYTSDAADEVVPV